MIIFYFIMEASFVFFLTVNEIEQLKLNYYKLRENFIKFCLYKLMVNLLIL